MAALIVLSVIIVVWALVEIVQADKAQIRRLPKLAWGIIALLVMPVGALAWFVFGRPKVAVGTSGRPAPGAAKINLPKRQRYIARPAPDDDPEFLRKLNAEAEQQKMFRRMQDDIETKGEAKGEAGDGEPRPRD